MKVIVIQFDDSVDTSPIVLGSDVTVNTVSGKVTFIGQVQDGLIADTRIVVGMEQKEG